MEKQTPKKKKYVGIFANRYLLILGVFVIWMVFLDRNSYLTHKEFNKEIEELETWIDIHKKIIEKDKETIKKLENSKELERYAREKYLMKKKYEDIYIIEFDTLK